MHVFPVCPARGEKFDEVVGRVSWVSADVWGPAPTSGLIDVFHCRWHIDQYTCHQNKETWRFGLDGNFEAFPSGHPNVRNANTNCQTTCFLSAPFHNRDTKGNMCRESSSSHFHAGFHWICSHSLCVFVSWCPQTAAQDTVSSWDVLQVHSASEGELSRFSSLEDFYLHQAQRRNDLVQLLNSTWEKLSSINENHSVFSTNQTINATGVMKWI